ncbi:MAG: sulfate reduction electron transfer complex DsrMKJOP subunit DsrO [Nitrospirota bacterium]
MINRRQFLKIAGISSIAGLGGISVSNVLKRNWLEASQVEPDPKAIVGKRWGMVVDMRRFNTEEDYRVVMDACHRVHNVPDIGNPKQEIKWIWKETYEHAFPSQEFENPYIEERLKEKPFIVLCNHCDNPPCVRVCPTKATFKRKSDGIVMMDMHRCIGCRFCMAGCPFGARSFNWRDPRPFIKKENVEFPTRTKGVVEKCTFCYERLATGLIPACVDASREAAKKAGKEPGLIFGDLKDPNSEIREVLSSNFTIRRKPELGTMPSVFYIIGG